MAKYDIDYACGHEETKQLYGKISARESYLTWAESRDCPECWRAKQNEEAKKVNEEKGLPALVGSEKQVAWAESIRAKAMPSLDELTEAVAKLDDSSEQVKKAKALLQATISNPQAKFWIDNRNQSYNRTWLLSAI